MVFMVRGKSADKDCLLRVHAEDQKQAEQIGWKRCERGLRRRCSKTIVEDLGKHRGVSIEQSDRIADVGEHRDTRSAVRRKDRDELKVPAGAAE